MAESCKAPDGSVPWGAGMSKWTAMAIVSILGFLPLTVLFLGPKLVLYVGGTFGYYLRKKTAGRKAQILDLVESEEKDYAANAKNRRDSDDWENVESYATGTANNGEKADREWDGIVGFFHPFWCVFTICECIQIEHVTDLR